MSWIFIFIKDIKPTESHISSFVSKKKNKKKTYNILHNEVRCNTYRECRSTWGHIQTWTCHNNAAPQRVRGVQESSGSQTTTENTENTSYLFPPYTMKSFNEQLHVPSGDPCCHESCSISVPFHPALLLQT